MPIKAGKVVYKDFGACVRGFRNKGKSPESARKICGALQARQEGNAAANASQVPDELKPHFNRSVKTLDFLRQQGVLADDDNDNDNDNDIPFVEDPPAELDGGVSSSLDNSVPKPIPLNNLIYSDPESYEDKITRIMDEYQISEGEAKKIVGKIIQDQLIELDRRQQEVTKQMQIEKTLEPGPIDPIEASNEGEQQESEENVGDNTTDRVGETNA